MSVRRGITKSPCTASARRMGHTDTSTMPSRLKRYNVAGHAHFLTVSCFHRLPFFGTPDTRDAVVRCMAHSQERLGFQWLGYVIMPEHVHWLIWPEAPSARGDTIPISSILLSLKTSIGMRVKALLRDRWRDHRTLGDGRLDRWATGPYPSRPIGTTRGIDVNVRSAARIWRKLDYCHANPVRRGLVHRAEDWPWSSYRYYSFGDMAPCPIFDVRGL
jgi:putative transposase